MPIARVLVPAKWAGAVQGEEEISDGQEGGMRHETQLLNLFEGVQAGLDLREWVHVKRLKEDPADALD